MGFKVDEEVDTQLVLEDNEMIGALKMGINEKTNLTYIKFIIVDFCWDSKMKNFDILGSGGGRGGYFEWGQEWLSKVNWLIFNIDQNSKMSVDSTRD